MYFLRGAHTHMTFYPHAKLENLSVKYMLLHIPLPQDWRISAELKKDLTRGVSFQFTTRCHLYATKFHMNLIWRWTRSASGVYCFLLLKVQQQTCDSILFFNEGIIITHLFAFGTRCGLIRFTISCYFLFD